MINPKQKWQSLSGAQRKKWLIRATIAVLLLASAAAITTDIMRGSIRKREAAEVTQIVDPVKRNLSMEDLAVQINALSQRLDQQQLNRNAQVTPGSLSAEDVQRMIDANKPGNSAGFGSASEPVFVPPGQLPADAAAFAPGQANTAAADEERSPYKTHTSNSKTATAGSTSNAASGSSAGTAADSKGGPRIHDTRSYLPPGSVLSFMAVSGINAPTSESTQKNPMPVLLRVKGEAIMPNGFRTDLSDCVVIANAYGQMADERAMMRTERISCIRSDGKAVEADIKGTVMGEDGKPGLRGRLVSKSGEVIAQMMKVGALNTLGQMGVAVAGTANVGHNSSDGGGNTFNFGTGGAANQAVLTSAANGINDIFGRIAGIYEQYARQTFPVIEINPMRTGDILITEGIALDYEKDKR